MTNRILITGTSSGFGKLMSIALLKNGHHVIAAMREPTTRNKAVAQELTNLGAQIVEIDVTNDDSVRAGVAAAGHVDILINNAGIGVLGLQETFTTDDWKRVFEINVFGVQRMCRAILPQMRERQDGLLIHISSLLGRFVLPFFGPYNATKYALEALADNYRVELSGLGIESVLIEPGAFGTDFGAHLIRPSDQACVASYGEMQHAPELTMENFGQVFEKPDAPKPDMVAEAVVELIATPKGQRPFRTTVDGLGMKDPIEPYNAKAEETTEAIYNAFGMTDMLAIK